MKHLLACVALLVTLGACESCAATFPASRTPAEVVHGEDARSVLIQGLTTEGGYFCSGVLVSATQVVTAAHCAPEGALMVGTREDGSQAFLEVEVLLPKLDLVRLKVMLDVDLPGFGSLGGFGGAPDRVVVGPSPALDDRECVAAAIPRRDHKCGRVQFNTGGDDMFYFDAIVEHGNSGAGVYDDAGRLVGIADVLYNAQNGQIVGGGARAITAALAWLVHP